MSTKIFTISMPTDFVALIDEQAVLNFSTRSEYIKATLLQRLKSEGVIKVPSITLAAASVSPQPQPQPPGLDPAQVVS